MLRIITLEQLIFTKQPRAFWKLEIKFYNIFQNEINLEGITYDKIVQNVRVPLKKWKRSWSKTKKNRNSNFRH